MMQTTTTTLAMVTKCVSRSSANPLKQTTRWPRFVSLIFIVAFIVVNCEQPGNAPPPVPRQQIAITFEKFKAIQR
jgi:hypothetical protein